MTVLHADGNADDRSGAKFTAARVGTATRPPSGQGSALPISTGSNPIRENAQLARDGIDGFPLG